MGWKGTNFKAESVHSKHARPIKAWVPTAYVPHDQDVLSRVNDEMSVSPKTSVIPGCTIACNHEPAGSSGDQFWS